MYSPTPASFLTTRSVPHTNTEQSALTEKFMVEQDIQSPYLLQDLIADERVPFTAWPGIQRNGDPLSSWLDPLPPIPDQSAPPVTTISCGVGHIIVFKQGPWHLAVAPLPSTLSPTGQIPGAVAHMTPASDRFDNDHVWDSIMTFANNQTHWNSSQPGQDATNSLPPIPIADHSPGQRVVSPFAQINDVQFHDHNPFVNEEFHGPHESPQPFPYVPVPHSMSLFQPHLDPIADAIELTGPQRGPEISNVQGPRHRGTGSEECPYVNCDKSYGRRQDLKRHIRDKHRISPRCPFCGIESTRAEKIRRHLVVQHRARFSSEERQVIDRLRGWEATIRLLEQCGTTT